jgi:hypothetical protein
MKTPPATPYLLPPEDAFTAHPWTWPDGAEISDRVDHWDPYTDLEMTRVIDIDLDVMRSACSLGLDAAFGIVASWYSNRTRLAADGPVVELGALGGLVRAPLTMRVPGTESGGRLDIHTRVVLRHPGLNPSPISPKRRGATLWHQRSSVQLEGSASRFPVTPVDFSVIPRLPDQAAWVLEWDRDELEAPVLGGLRLLINSRDERLVGALRSGSKDPNSALVRSFVRYDVSKSLIHGALDNDRFVEEAETFDEGSIGRMLFELLSLFWPGYPVKALRSRRAEDPSRLDAEIQTQVGVLR